MPRAPAAIRYLTLHRLAFAVTALTVLVTATATAATAAFASSAAAVANRETLTDNPASTILITAPTTQFGSASAQVVRTIRDAAPGLPMNFAGAQQTTALNLPGGRATQTFLLELPGFRQHAKLVTGSWPGSTAAGTVQVCLPARAAQMLGLTVGDKLTVHDSLTKAAMPISIACTFTERNPTAPYWLLDSIGPSAVSRVGGFTSYGPMITSQPASTWPVAPTTGEWLATPDFAAMTAGNLSALGGMIQDSLTKLANSTLTATITTSLPTLLADQAVALEVARSQLLIGLLILLVIAGASLTVAVSLLASQRAGQPGLLKARGATRRQLAAWGGVDAALLAIPAAIGGPLIGVAVAPLVARLGIFGVGALRLPASLPLVAWLAGIAVAAGCALVIALPWLREPPSPIRRRAAMSRRRGITAALSSGADVALVLLAAGAGWQLAHYSASVSTGVSGAIGVDPILVAAPVLALTAGTLIMLRLLPLLIRMTERMAARGRGITAPTAAWMISRRAIRQAGPALLIVLAVATSVIALAESSSWRQSIHDQASFAVGADAAVVLPPDAPLTIGQVANVTKARGVQNATPVINVPFILPDNEQATLLAVNPGLASQIVPVRSDLLVKPKRHPFASIAGTADQPGVAIPGRPTELRVAASLTSQPSETLLVTPTGAPVGLVTSRLAGSFLNVQVSDAAGVSYQLSAGSLSGDGASHVFDIPIGQHADYPLRLTGFSLTYNVPTARPAHATLSIQSVTPLSGNGRAGRPIPALWQGSAEPSAGLSRGARRPPGLRVGLGSLLPVVAVNISVPSLSPDGQRAYGSPRLTTLAQHGHGADLSFVTGAGQSTTGSTAAATLTVSAPAPTALPAIATSAFLAASGQHLGSVIQVSGMSQPVSVQIVGEMTQFPTVTTPAGGIVVNQAALQAYLEANGSGAQSVTEWLTSDRGQPSFHSLPLGSTVTTRAAVLRSLIGQPLAVAPLRSLLAVAAIALLLACLGFLVSASASRERTRDLAILDALGATPGQLSRLLCLEQGILSVPAAAGGFALGLLLSRLIIPAVTLTAQATHPLPSVLVRVPLVPSLAIAAAIAAVPIAVVAATVLGGTGTMAMLRAEEET